LRGKIKIPVGTTKEVALDLARADSEVQRHLSGVTSILKVIYVQDRLLNLVVSYATLSPGMGTQSEADDVQS
jgi:hypothetical protein